MLFDNTELWPFLRHQCTQHVSESSLVSTGGIQLPTTAAASALPQLEDTVKMRRMYCRSIGKLSPCQTALWLNWPILNSQQGQLKWKWVTVACVVSHWELCPASPNFTFCAWTATGYLDVAENFYRGPERIHCNWRSDVTKDTEVRASDGMKCRHVSEQCSMMQHGSRFQSKLLT